MGGRNVKKKEQRRGRGRIEEIYTQGSSLVKFLYGYDKFTKNIQKTEEAEGRREEAAKQIHFKSQRNFNQQVNHRNIFNSDKLTRRTFLIQTSFSSQSIEASWYLHVHTHRYI